MIVDSLFWGATTLPAPFIFAITCFIGMLVVQVNV